MAVSFTTFVAVFPEFNNLAVYPEAQFDFWAAQGYSQLNASRFGAQLDLGVMLFAAHNMVLAARNARAAGGGLPGATSGPVSSETVGPTSATYDTGAVADPAAGEWNLTSYGQRLWRLMQAKSLGPVYVPGPRGPYAGRVFG